MTDREDLVQDCDGAGAVDRLIPIDDKTANLRPPRHFQRTLVFDLSLGLLLTQP